MFDIVKLLVERGISIIANSMCVLNWTSWTEHYEVMDYLLSQEEFKSIDKDTRTDKLGELMSNSTSSTQNLNAKSKLEMVKVLLKHGGNPMGYHSDQSSRYNEPLRNACQKNLHKIVKLLLEKGAKPDEMYFDERETILCKTAAQGFLKPVELLIEYGADVNAYDGLSLRLACKGNHVEVVKCLLSNGANPKLKNHAAIQMTNNPIIKDILRNYK